MLFSAELFGRIESINVARVFQEAGDAEPKARPRSQCRLNISSFLTLPHLLDCLICTRNSVSIVLLLGMIGDGIGGAWLIHIRVWVGGQAVGIIS